MEECYKKCHEPIYCYTHLMQKNLSQLSYVLPHTALHPTKACCFAGTPCDFHILISVVSQNTIMHRLQHFLSCEYLYFRTVLT